MWTPGAAATATAPDHARPRISVVMPSLNQAQFLEEAVRSVLEQGVDGIELVVMDGGSADGSVPLLARLAESFSGQLRWFSGPDGGPAQAINRAVAQARGELIGWLNSDDLYTPGAIQRAVDHLTAHPDIVMAYGNADHVDAQGAWIEAYPTQLPTTPLNEFANGCFICQPSAFFRREAFMALGGLNAELRAAFDFDLWLRMFKAYPGRIGFVPALQARSRLHDASITMRFRERVALEGIRVVSEHLGAAPAHWLLTHLDELVAEHPFHAEPIDIPDRMAGLVEASQGQLKAGGADEVHERIAGDARIRLATAHTAVGVYPDGWAPPDLEVRFRQPPTPWRGLRLLCHHAAPGGGVLHITVHSPDGGRQPLVVEGQGPFEIELTASDGRADARLIFRLHTEGGFVPALCEPGSADRRTLTFQVQGCEALR